MDAMRGRLSSDNDSRHVLLRNEQAASDQERTLAMLISEKCLRCPLGCKWSSHFRVRLKTSDYSLHAERECSESRPQL
jgi:hypothetical protein